jgi:hypothetical protein
MPSGSNEFDILPVAKQHLVNLVLTTRFGKETVLSNILEQKA